jgi:hypothetical protein
MASVKKAADASGRRVAFVGMSLNTYLEAAARWGGGGERGPAPLFAGAFFCLPCHAPPACPLPANQLFFELALMWIPRRLATAEARLIPGPATKATRAPPAMAAPPLPPANAHSP